jgi:hypothetical protein
MQRSSSCFTSADLLLLIRIIRSVKSNPMASTPRDQVFISYSHKDAKWRKDLEIHLKPYLREGSITSWSDEQITPGSSEGLQREKKNWLNTRCPY